MGRLVWMLQQGVGCFACHAPYAPPVPQQLQLLARTRQPTHNLQVCAAGALLAVLGREGRLGGGGGGEAGLMIVNGISEARQHLICFFINGSGGCGAGSQAGGWAARMAGRLRQMCPLDFPRCATTVVRRSCSHRRSPWMAPESAPASPALYQHASNTALSPPLSTTPQVSLDGYLTVDPPSLAALQIFQEEAHPAAAMGIGGCWALLHACRAASGLSGCGGAGGGQLAGKGVGEAGAGQRRHCGW